MLPGRKAERSDVLALPTAPPQPGRAPQSHQSYMEGVSCPRRAWAYPTRALQGEGWQGSPCPLLEPTSLALHVFQAVA